MLISSLQRAGETEASSPRQSVSSNFTPQLLAVSYSYPPQTEPRAIQVSRLLEHLRIPTIIVSEGQPENYVMNRDSAANLIKEVRVPLPDSTWRRLPNRLSARLNIPVFFRTPDHLHPWKNAALFAIRRLIEGRSYRPDLLVTFSYPLIDSIIGIEVKRRFGLPWLAHFSDPWVDSPFKTYDPMTRALNLRLERRVMESADRIVFTSSETADLVMAKYDRALQSKVRVVPHAFESSLYPERTQGNDGRMAIRYLGDLYSGRTPQPLFSALATLIYSDPELVTRFVFEIIGDVHQLDLEKLGLAKLPPNLVVFRPRVDYLESLSLMRSAAGLMVIDAPVPENSKSVFLPSKLIEYVGAGQPIIGLTPPGAAADLIRKLGGWAADPSNPSELARVMRSFLISLQQRSNENGDWGTPDVRKLYEATAVADEFKKVLLELINRNY